MVTCQISIDGDNPGSGGISNFVISGTGFQASELVDIFENNSLALTKTADGFGSYSARIGILRTLNQTEHVFFARGQSSNRISWKAGVSV